MLDAKDVQEIMNATWIPSPHSDNYNKLYDLKTKNFHIYVQNIEIPPQEIIMPDEQKWADMRDNLKDMINQGYQDLEPYVAHDHAAIHRLEQLRDEIIQRLDNTADISGPHTEKIVRVNDICRADPFMDMVINKDLGLVSLIASYEEINSAHAKPYKHISGKDILKQIKPKLDEVIQLNF